jgi:hypothetical protein
MYDCNVVNDGPPVKTVEGDGVMWEEVETAEVTTQPASTNRSITATTKIFLIALPSAGVMALRASTGLS